MLIEDLFHGSPHQFKAFSTDHIGSGEGHMTYGWGLYFTSTREVAEFYRKSLARSFTYNGRRVDPESWLHTAIYQLLYHDWDKQAVHDMWKPGVKMHAVIDKVDPAKVKIKGHVYDARVPDDSEFILWDEPYSQQSSKVQSAFERMLRNGFPRFGAFVHEIVPFSKDMTGGEMYDALSRVKRGEKNASLALLADGIHGIKYLDGKSRDTGEGSYNFVIFDADLVEMTGKT